MPLGKLDPNRYLGVTDRGDPYLVIVPNAGRHLLMTLIEAAAWQTKYDPVPTGDPWDTLSAIQAATLDGLMRGEKVGEITDAIDRVVTAIYERECCPPTSSINDAFDGTPNGVGGSDTTIAPVGEDDQILDPGDGLSGGANDGTYDHIDLDSDGTIGATEWDAHVCRGANWIYDTLIDLARMMKLANFLFFTAVDVLQWFVSKLVRRVVVGPADDVVLTSLDFLYELEAAMTADISAAAWDTTIAELEAARDDTVCCMAQAGTAGAMIQCMSDSVNANVTLSAAGTLLLAGPWLSLGAFVWRGLVDPPESECDCAPQYEFDVTLTATNGPAWVLSRASVSGSSWRHTPRSSQGNSTQTLDDADLAAFAGVVGEIRLQLIEVVTEGAIGYVPKGFTATYYGDGGTPIDITLDVADGQERTTTHVPAQLSTTPGGQFFKVTGVANGQDTTIDGFIKSVRLAGYAE